MNDIILDKSRQADWTVRKGQTIDQVITVSNSDATPYDFTDHSVVFEICTLFSAVPVMTLDVTLSSGQIRLQKSSTLMNLKGGSRPFMYFMWVTFGDGTKRLWLNGRFNVNQQLYDTHTGVSSIVIDNDGPLITLVVDGGGSGQLFKGMFVSLAALQTAYPTGNVGWYAYVDAGVGVDPITYVWDTTDSQWTDIGSATGNVIAGNTFVNGQILVAGASDKQANSSGFKLIELFTNTSWGPYADMSAAIGAIGSSLRTKRKVGIISGNKYRESMFYGPNDEDWRYVDDLLLQSLHPRYLTYADDFVTINGNSFRMDDNDLHALFYEHKEIVVICSKNGVSNQQITIQATALRTYRKITFVVTGTAGIYITPDDGVTQNSLFGSGVSAGQYAVVTVTPLPGDLSYVLSGDIVAGG